MKHFRFNENYNNKLNLDIFTTIRPNDPKKIIKPGDIVEIILKGRKKGKAEVIFKRYYIFEDIPTEVLILDTGFHLNQPKYLEMFSQFYPGIRLIDRMIVYTLRWVTADPGPKEV